ncbi:MAG: KUP/HAK/KT family potassium transporter [Solirubrobacterales bacterium]|nr:KUP/HAK/KT family potassium transporter [Solirubrobacterales bacterium]MBV9714516.1 KUP/HAK/KT family potassium transporter [Solirubrobacterales bacterium]
MTAPDQRRSVLPASGSPAEPQPDPAPAPEGAGAGRQDSGSDAEPGRGLSATRERGPSAGQRRTDAEPSPAAPRAPRSFNEAAHKLGAWPVRPAPLPKEAPKDFRSDDHRDVVAHASRLVLALGALGIVYGDLGTSPLYTVQTIFGQHADAARPTLAGVYGVVSLIFWALMIEVSFKYAGFIMRAHNRGDGGIMALAALVQRRKVPHAGALVILGIFGAGLFFGDGMITPAISVISSVEGLNVVSPSLSHLVVPISLTILVLLFAVQRYGTGAVGWLFGPIILLFFTIIAVLGATQVARDPSVVQGLSPTWAVRFMVDHGVAAFLTLGGVVLCVTGAEALYADRGHFGAGPIRFTWFLVVLPAVLLSYLGQSALILHHPADIANPFFLLVPHALLIPMVILATMATIIASQAAITGSYSVARQAVQLGLLPRLRVRHTSETEGQIYVPVINWLLATGVVALIVGFRHSAKLADIYGVAVTGTFILNTILFLAVARSLWRTPRWRLAILGGLFLTVEVAFFSANVSKVEHGAYLPLCVGLVFAFVMITWRRGREIVTRNRIEEEGSLTEFLEDLRTGQSPISRVPGTAVFLNPGRETTPLALRAEVERIHAMHEKVLIVSIDPVSVPHVEPSDRLVTDTVGTGLCKIIHVTIRVGYRDSQDVPAALALARKQGLLSRNLDLEHAAYIVSRMTITPSADSGMARWRKALFIAMARNAATPMDQFKLPAERTVMMGSQVAL